MRVYRYVRKGYSFTRACPVPLPSTFTLPSLQLALALFQSWIAKLPIDFVAEANVAQEVALGGERVDLVDKGDDEEECAD